MKKRFNKRYKSGDLPWNIDRPDFNLANTLKEFEISKGLAMDIGCGTGDNVFFLSKSGFESIGIDISPKAIEIAKEKATQNKIEADFFIRDIFKDDVPEGPFSFIFDRGCFHTFQKKKQRIKYAKKVHELLDENGYWLSLLGNFDDGRLDIGPPKRTALDIVTAVEPLFEIISLKQGRFDSNDEIPSIIWVALMRKRKEVNS